MGLSFQNYGIIKKSAVFKRSFEQGMQCSLIKGEVGSAINALMSVCGFYMRNFFKIQNLMQV